MCCTIYRRLSVMYYLVVLKVSCSTPTSMIKVQERKNKSFYSPVSESSIH